MNEKQLKRELLAIGERIRFERTLRKMTLPECARKAKLSKATWSRLENGKLNFTYHTLRKVSTVLDVPIEYLLP